MHTLRNRKTDRKSARRRFTEARRTSQTAIYPHLGGEIQHSNSNFQTFVGLKPECDAHICLSLGFTSQNFRLSQVSLRVCYFWLSSFRMDEGNHLPGEHGPCPSRDRQFKWSHRHCELSAPTPIQLPACLRSSLSACSVCSSRRTKGDAHIHSLYTLGR
jgi:hypothetical protein